jgi:AraC-like DNA-binding protein
MGHGELNQHEADLVCSIRLQACLILPTSGVARRSAYLFPERRTRNVEALKQAVQRYADRHADSEGLAATPIPGLRMMRASSPRGPMRSVYKPLVCLVLQGAKQVSVGREEQVFTAGQSIVVGVDVPVVGRIVRASRSEPYLAVAIELDMAIMQSVASHVRLKPPPAAHTSSTLFTESLDDDVLKCTMRLMRLIDRPEAVPVVRPAVLQELHYWLLSSKHGTALSRLALPDGHTQRVARAIDVIRSRYREPIAVEQLAAVANMSSSAFHRHFRAVTSLSPLQFQKQLRLIEARRLMLGEGTTASRAAADVGYESASQFTREYVRMFGASPRRDAARPVLAVPADAGQVASRI